MAEPPITQIIRDSSGREVYCDRITKADGRSLTLYGHAQQQLRRLDEMPVELARGGELRFHPLRQEWNIYAAHRQNRTFKPTSSEDPLSPSQPGMPPTEIPFEDFDLAIFENKFSALHDSAQVPQPISGVQVERAIGASEVVVYSPAKEGCLWTIGQQKRELLVAAWEHRYEELFKSGARYVLPFENRGDEVGVTLHHPHGQIYAFHRTPAVQRTAIAAFANGFDLWSAVRDHEKNFVIAETKGVRAFAPPFARFPYEVWIAPISPREGLSDMTDTEKQGFAELLGEITRRYDAFFQRPAATMMALHAAPAGGAPNYHFTAQFYPILRSSDRVKFLASVEQHAGVMTVDVLPETAAAELRKV